MIPKSRKVTRGAYRNVVPNTINGEVDETSFLAAIGNKLSTRLSSLIINEYGNFNTIEFYKRRIATKRGEVFTAELTTDVGTENNGRIRLMTRESGDINLSITLGSQNHLDLKTYDDDDIVVGNNNTILGELNTKNGGVAIGNNNFLVDFKPEIEEGVFVKGFPRQGSLMFETVIMEYAGVGQNYILVENTEKVTYGMEVIFGSVAAGFVRREVTATSWNKIFFDMPLTAREATFPDAQVFNEYYEILPEYASTLSVDAERRTKRIFVEDNQSLHLRKVTIDGTFNTLVFFMRAEDNMTIIKDLTPELFEEGTTIVSPEVNPYRAWAPTLTQDVDTPEKYSFVGENVAHIGRTCTVNAIDYRVVDFDATSIVFNEVLPEGTVSVSFEALDHTPSGEMVTTKVSMDIAGNSVTIPLDNTVGFFLGQRIKLEGMSTVGIIQSKTATGITLENSLFEDTVDDAFYVGKYELPRGKNTARAVINTASADLHNYIFGDN